MKTDLVCMAKICMTYVLKVVPCNSNLFGIKKELNLKAARTGCYYVIFSVLQNFPKGQKSQNNNFLTTLQIGSRNGIADLKADGAMISNRPGNNKKGCNSLFSGLD